MPFASTIANQNNARRGNISTTHQVRVKQVTHTDGEHTYHTTGEQLVWLLDEGTLSGFTSYDGEMVHVKF